VSECAIRSINNRLGTTTTTTERLRRLPNATAALP
jgi:hypothetical protein